MHFRLVVRSSAARLVWRPGGLGLAASDAGTYQTMSILRTVPVGRADWASPNGSYLGHGDQIDPVE